MAKKHYDWREGPAVIDGHSITKHEVLVEYLKRYFTQRTLNARGRDRFRITLVDGFCGGGEYVLKGTSQIVDGSPLRIIDAVEQAQKLVNTDRVKPLSLDVQYVFVDESRAAVEYLRSVLVSRGYGGQIGKSIHLVCSEFAATYDAVISVINMHTPKTPTALFFLDQYGYTDVPAPLVRTIFNQVRNAEIVLTFHVSSFATYTNDELVARVSETLQVDLKKHLLGRTVEEIKSDDADWRRFIQGALYQSLVEGCNALYFTPFFIRGTGANHGEYWLVHLSQHPRAQDVMKQVHWQHHNHFVHYGGAGLNMLAPQTMGFRQEFDGGFAFDDVAQASSDKALFGHLDKYIHAHRQPQTVGTLFSSTCNGSPATVNMYKNALERLIQDDRVVVFSDMGTRRSKARLIEDSDIVELAKQTRLLPIS
jgi:three-Cys-motif partner protein